MATLLALPEEVLEIIFHYLVRSSLEATEGAACRTRIAAQIATQLRLVCRSWATWLLQHILYRRLAFSSDSRIMDFLNQIVQPGSIRKAGCQNLVIRRLWHGRPGYQSRGDRSLTSLGSVESFLGLFSDSIFELDLEFVDSFGFQSRTISAIGALENLSVLRLGLQLDQITANAGGYARSSWQVVNFEPESLRALLCAARQLVSLDLTRLPLSLLPVFGPDIEAKQLARISHLDIKLVGEQPLEPLVSLCIALRHSLKVLSIQSFRDDLQQLLPAFHCLKDTLEGLFISDESALHHIADLDFLKLRVFRIHYWDDCISHLLNRDMFAHAPLEVVAVYSHTVYRRKRKFASDPFQRLAHLKRFVFLHARLDDQPPLTYVNACKAHQIECVFLSHGAISDIMKL